MRMCVWWGYLRIDGQSRRHAAGGRPCRVRQQSSRPCAGQRTPGHQAYRLPASCRGGCFKPQSAGAPALTGQAVGAFAFSQLPITLLTPRIALLFQFLQTEMRRKFRATQAVKTDASWCEVWRARVTGRPAPNLCTKPALSPYPITYSPKILSAILGSNPNHIPPTAPDLSIGAL